MFLLTPFLPLPKGFPVHRPSLPLGSEWLPLLKLLIMDLAWKNLKLAHELMLLACLPPILHTHTSSLPLNFAFYLKRQKCHCLAKGNSSLLGCIFQFSLKEPLTNPLEGVGMPSCLCVGLKKQCGGGGGCFHL